MTAFKAYLNSRKVQKVLSKKPGEEGFSLIELVVVIAVLAILAAVAIPAFNGIQNDARASAVKSGMANGIKECLVLEARGKTGTDLGFTKAKAFNGEYKAYAISEWTGFSDSSGCMRVRGIPTSDYENTLPNLYMAIDGEGVVTKACGTASLRTEAAWNAAGVTGKDYCW